MNREELKNEIKGIIKELRPRTRHFGGLGEFDFLVTATSPEDAKKLAKEVGNQFDLNSIKLFKKLSSGQNVYSFRYRSQIKVAE